MECKICNKEIFSGNKCSNCSRAMHRYKRKIKCVEYKGGECEICGYNKSYNALQFHHINPKEKDFNISANSSWGVTGERWELTKKELDKCLLVCANCHAELHEDPRTEQLIEYIEYMKYAPEPIKILPNRCICGKDTKYKYCSPECSYKHMEKIEWPGKEELKKLVWEIPTTEIAHSLGVSDKSVSKRCKKYGIEKPPRGYWRKKETNKA